MDLTSFCKIVDEYQDGISNLKGDLNALYDYVGLPQGSILTLDAVSKELYIKINKSFISGHQSVWRNCRQLRQELIQRHIIDGESLEPYFSVVERLQDAVRSDVATRDEIEGEWIEAIGNALDHLSLKNWGTEELRERLNTRCFEVAKAAKNIQDKGYKLIRQSGDIFIQPESETSLVNELERLIKSMGGINIARRIFKRISHNYDELQERYHLVRHISQTGGGNAQPPFGYLLQLSAKHPTGRKPLKNTDENWDKLLELAKNYIAVLDVQSYTPSIWGAMDAESLLPYLQELALHDTLFCIHQIRGSDLIKLAGSLLGDLDFEQSYGTGWTINDVLIVIGSILELSRGVRGPTHLTISMIKELCPELETGAISKVLDDVLSHPISGANQYFSKPTDAPQAAPLDSSLGHDYFQKPLLKIERDYYFMLDRAMCSPAFLEAIFTELRTSVKKFDDKVIGPAVEKLLKEEFKRHNISTKSGKYTVNGKDGECDLVIETIDTVIFVEIKKKSLTRNARAGIDAYVLLDLANSILDAQVQAGWHEIRLRQNTFIELDDNGNKSRLEFNDRNVMRIAVTLFDYGSFQDRTLLKQFLEGNINVQYSARDDSLKKRFDSLNKSLVELTEQFKIFSDEQKDVINRFHNCWFLSIPQLLIVIDGVNGAEAFQKSLRSSAGMTTGSLDFYHEHAYMKSLNAKVVATNQ